MATTRRRTTKHPAADSDMRAGYDFSKGVRGKYYERFKGQMVRTVVLDPDVAKVFPDSESVNNALQAMAEVASKWSKPAPARRKKAG